MKIRDIHSVNILDAIIIWLCWHYYNRFDVMLYPYKKYRDRLQRRYQRNFEITH